MKKWIIVFILMLSACQLFSQRTDKKLQRQIESLIKGFHGDIGVFVKNLKNGKSVAINGDSVFPTASIVKIPILIGVMDKIHRGELSYHQELQYKDSLLYEGVDILGSFKSDEKIELGKLLMLMMTMSDNTASLWLQSLAGTGTRINEIMDSLGLNHTRVNSRTPGRELARSLYGWGQMTPKEMASLLERIYRRQIISPAASDRMLRNLNRNYWDAESLSQIPPYAAIFSKNGAVDASRSEVVLVRGLKSNYVFCIATKNNNDQSWESTNEAWVLARKISGLLWNYFEKGNDWRPATDAVKYH